MSSVRRVCATAAVEHANRTSAVRQEADARIDRTSRGETAAAVLFRERQTESAVYTNGASPAQARRNLDEAEAGLAEVAVEDRNGARAEPCFDDLRVNRAE